jgi:hypothetical protein
MLPRWLLIAGGCVSAGALISMGALVFFGLLSSALGLTNGPATLNGAGLLVALVYGSWLALGLALAAATRDFQARTRIAALAS